MVEPPYRIKNMMPGMIMLWYGSFESIPSGWTICDGTMGTPDLRNKLLYGAGGIYTPNVLQGSNYHFHVFEGDGHAHDIPAGVGLAAGTDFYLTTTSDPAVGETEVSLHKPYGLRLCFIMKL